MRDYTKTNHKGMRYALDSSGLGQEPMASTSEHCNKPLGSAKEGQYLD